MAERSTDAQFLKPAVLSLAFGVLFALFVSLLMVPALYCIGDDLRTTSQRFKVWLGAQWRGVAPEVTPKTAPTGLAKSAGFRPEN